MPAARGRQGRLDDLVCRYPDFGIAMMHAFSLRLRWVAQLALGLETGSALERICTVLLALSERFGESSDEGVVINLNLTREQLAAIAGVTRQFAELGPEHLALARRRQDPDPPAGARQGARGLRAHAAANGGDDRDLVRCPPR